jgi:hypothetical protein
MNISEMGGGTPIGMLRKDVVEQQAKQMNEQHIRQYMDDRNINIDEQRQKEDDEIDALINQINTDSSESKPKKKKTKLNKKIKSKKLKDTETDTDEEKKEEKDEKKSKSKSKLSFKMPFKIPEFTKDPLLIWIIFILLSQNFIKQLIGKYVKQINPNEEGVVSFMGVVIYGLIFAVLFGLIKFLLNLIL